MNGLGRCFIPQRRVEGVLLNSRDYPIPKTRLNDSYWSGGPKDKGDPKPLKVLGDYVKPGERVPSGTDVADDPPGTFTRYQINGTGESFGATREVEAQVLADIH
jgi:hypothetical protein